jgi:hypothetical protein
MANLDRRDDFIKRWFEKASVDQDVFDKFFSLWIALVVAAQKLNDYSSINYQETDGLKIKRYFEEKSKDIVLILEQNKELIKKLIDRKGTRFHDPVLDIRCHPKRELVRKFVEHYQQEIELSDHDIVEALSIIITRIRNNTFHGCKNYNDTSDISLLSIITPIIEAILLKCEPVLSKSD